VDFNNKTPEEIQKIIADAQAALIEKQKSERKETIAKIKALADSIGVTVTIHETGKKADRRQSSVAIKYRNPHNQAETWTGRGLKPKWVNMLLSQGYSLDSLAI